MFALVAASQQERARRSTVSQKESSLYDVESAARCFSLDDGSVFLLLPPSFLVVFLLPAHLLVVVWWRV